MIHSTYDRNLISFCFITNDFRIGLSSKKCDHRNLWWVNSEDIIQNLAHRDLRSFTSLFIFETPDRSVRSNLSRRCFDIISFLRLDGSSSFFFVRISPFFQHTDVVEHIIQKGNIILIKLCDFLLIKSCTYAIVIEQCVDDEYDVFQLAARSWRLLITHIHIFSLR